MNIDEFEANIPYEDDFSLEIEDGPKIIGDINNPSPEVGLMIYNNDGEPTDIIFGYKEIEKYVKSKEWKSKREKSSRDN